MTNSIQPNIERLLTVVGHQRQRLLAHPLYGTIQTLEHVQVFMAHHAFAVWDFMSLVKALQVQLTGMRLPWKPHTGQLNLKRLNQRHKVPDGKGMVGHKYLHVFQGLDGTVKRMRQQTLPLVSYNGQ